MDLLENMLISTESPGFLETKALHIAESDLNNSAPTTSRVNCSWEHDRGTHYELLETQKNKKSTFTPHPHKNTNPSHCMFSSLMDCMQIQFLN
jgi:hypothetical protein